MTLRACLLALTLGLSLPLQAATELIQLNYRTAEDVLPVVQAVGLIFAAVYISLNIIADVAGILTNPRLRHPK